MATDPTEHLRTPRQWQTIPKYLNLEEIERSSRPPTWPGRPACATAP